MCKSTVHQSSRTLRWSSRKTSRGVPPLHLLLTSGQISRRLLRRRRGKVVEHHRGCQLLGQGVLVNIDLMVEDHLVTLGLVVDGHRVSEDLAVVD